MLITVIFDLDSKMTAICKPDWGKKTLRKLSLEQRPESIESDSLTSNRQIEEF